MRFKRLMGNNFLSRTIFRKLLPYMPREMLRTFMGQEALSPIEQFASNGYNRYLYQGLRIEQNELVIVLGGYLGASISEWRNRFDSHVISFEPIPEYAKQLSLDFRSDGKVLIKEFAASSHDGFIDLGIDGETTGKYSNSQTKLRVAAKDISKIVGEAGETLKVLEMNIEGGEYDNLERLIHTRLMLKVPTLLVQFHRYSVNEELRRAQIRSELEKTHFCVFEFPWVWERWDRKDEK